MTQNIINQINEAFPVAGENNSSQGFRDNFGRTKTALTEINSLTNRLANTTIGFSGDIVPTSFVLGSGAPPGNPAINRTLVLNNTLPGPVTLSSTAGETTLSFDSKGRLVGQTTTPFSVNLAAGHAFGSPIPITGSTSLGSGTGSIVLPTFTFNGTGRLIATGTRTFQFGLLDQTLNRGSLLIGNATNTSVEFPPPSGGNTFVLSAVGNSLSWLDASSLGGGGGVDFTGLSGQNGIQVTSSPASAIVRIRPQDFTNSTSLVNGDVIPFFLNGSLDLRSTSFGDFRTNIFTGGLFEQVSGGAGIRSSVVSPNSSLQVLQSGITASSGASSVVVDSTGLALQSPNLSLNGQVWPSSSGSLGQILTVGAGGSLVWSDPPLPFSPIDLANTRFVGTNGDNSTGTGEITTPYLTIGRALADIPDNDPTLWTIVLLGGVYTENVSVNQKFNISIESFYRSTNSTIRGSLAVQSSNSTFRMSNILVDGSQQPLGNTAPIFSVQGVLEGGELSNCSFIRGAGVLSDLPVIRLSGQLIGDLNFTNCQIAGVVENFLEASSGKVSFLNSRQPQDGWMGLEVTNGTNTLVSNIPLIRGVNHRGGILHLENVSSIAPREYELEIPNPSLPAWLGGEPLFVTTSGDSATIGTPGATFIEVLDDQGDPTEVLLLDPFGQPVPDPANPGDFLLTPFQQEFILQPPTLVTREVGLLSTGEVGDPGDPPVFLQLNNVSLLYQGQFSKIFKSGDAGWTFFRVSRRADQDFLSGPRRVHDIQPDSGEFVGHYQASGTTLTKTESGEPVVDGLIDPLSGNTFWIQLNNNSTLRFKTPDQTSYSSTSDPSSGEQITEIILAIRQDSTGDRRVNFLTTSSPINWLTPNQPLPYSNGVTFYSLKYFSVSRTWWGSRITDDLAVRVANTSVTPYTLTMQDAGSYLRRIGSAVNQVIVPTNNNVPFPIGTQIQIVQRGTGQVFVEPGAPEVLINTPFGLGLKGRMSRALLVKISTNAWDLTGDLDESLTSTTTITIDDENITVDNDNITADGGS